MLTEKIRWMAFLTHSHDEEDKITKEVYGNKTIENAGEWTAAHIKIGENTRTHKYEYLKALEVYPWFFLFSKMYLMFFLVQHWKGH